jgi:hypothetical protein
MKKRAISYIVAFIVLLSLCAGEESIRGFRAIDLVDLERKVPRGYGQVFVEAGRENNIDPVFLAAISAHESGQWKSRIARRSRRGPKSFGTPQESIFYAAKLLNRKPFQGRNTLSEIAPIYCAENPKYWESSVLGDIPTKVRKTPRDCASGDNPVAFYVPLLEYPLSCLTP